MKPITERVEENKSPVESKALPHENVVIRCWKPDCRKVATCRDGSGWEWCDDHIDQEKTGSVLHTAQEYYDVDFYTERVRVCLTETDQQAREECIAIVEEYGKNIQKLHEEMIGTTHEDCKQMLAYDMHSRLIAVKHILKYLSNPPSQV